MSAITVHGYGAVSPAGWDVASLRDAVERGQPLPTTDLARPGWQNPLRIRTVPPPAIRPAFVAHARLRRTSPITQYSVAAALEALGDDRELVAAGKLRPGIILCVMSGCVNYSRRFYDETLRDPATASPLVFPETVFNAPASHLAALIGTTAINYTLVGDPGTYLQGLALAADWLNENQVDACLVIGAEENDWLTADAFHLFTHQIILSDGAGALYLKRGPAPKKTVQLTAVTDSHLFSNRQGRMEAARNARRELPPLNGEAFLCDGLQSIPPLDRAEAEAWSDWTGSRLSPKLILGDAMMAASAWQCVLAIDNLRQSSVRSAVVSVVGCNQQAIAALFQTA